MMYTKNFEQLNKKDTNIAGGKGASLGEMTGAGIPVPPGFVVVADAFDRFLEKTDLGVEVEAVLNKVNPEDFNSVEKASVKIRDLIVDAEMPEDIGEEILDSHAKLGKDLVAVRSSATAEDSSIASWAGELESFMNVSTENLLETVKNCWSSLFTPRAIFYRWEKNLHEHKVSVAVVIQEMVQSEVSGICFTVHPVTEDIRQMVIEAGWGLGDAIVGGMITPDTYVVRKPNFEIEDANVSKQKMMLVQDSFGHKKVDVPTSKREKQKLSEGQIVELAKLCVEIEKHYGKPQDIEWAYENGKFYITQSRPITTLKAEVFSEEEIGEISNEKYERVFGGPGMPFLVSDLAVKTYVDNFHFLVTKIDDVWTCYMPLQKKQQTLKDGKKMFENSAKYKKYRTNYLKFIDDFSKKFDSIISGADPFTSDSFKNFVDLCRKSENFYGNTEYFVTDEVKTNKDFESDFGELKIKGRALLNSQYFSKNNYLERILKVVSSMTDINLAKLYQYNCGEIAALLEGKHVGIPDEKERAVFITYSNGDDVITLTGEEAKKQISIFQKKHAKDLTGLSGSIANKGKASGFVRILDTGYEHKNINRLLDKMEKGEILVAETTSPEIMIACKKAAAIITNQGGMMSHAAIVSRELNIPCIVGVEGATEVLQDGDFVEVDANLGVVNVAKRKNN